MIAFRADQHLDQGGPARLLDVPTAVVADAETGCTPADTPLGGGTGETADALRVP